MRALSLSPAKTSASLNGFGAISIASFSCLIAATCPRVCITEIASIPTIPEGRQNLEGFLDSALAQPGAAQTLWLAGKPAGRPEPRSGS